MHKKFENNRISPNSCDSHPAESLTKGNGNKVLGRILNGKDETKVVEWIVREIRHNEGTLECDESSN